ncbi:MAG: galactose oxidase-like domain-containing protein [Vicinamibacterales bacterium]
MTTGTSTPRFRYRRWLAALVALVAAVSMWRTTGRAATPPVSLAKWTAPIGLPLVPVGAAILPTGNVLFWASNQTNNFTANGNTQTVIFDPSTNSSFAYNITQTAHNMFCPGTAMLPDGRLLINGGYDAPKTSIYNPATNSWSTAATMNLARGYNGSTLLSDGTVLTLGGGWSGGSSAKAAEIFTKAGTWRTLSGVPDSTEFMINGTYSSWQNSAHYNLIPTGNGQVLLASPGPNMFWINPNGNGSYSAAGPRGDDGPAFSTNTVMYEAGKILKVGGSTWNTGGMAANSSAYIIDTTQGAATVTRLPNMAYARGHHNSVVLPNGQVIVIGGQTAMEEFSDAYAVLAPELFDPATNTFTVMPSMSVARNYHSIALLLPDGRVLSGGGGLCACAGDHQDVQILSPPYLFNADGSAAPRPVITSTPSTLGYGTTVTVTTNAAVNAFSLVRLNATTHGVNNDQRRVALSFTATDATHYQVSIPTNSGVLLPGKWMLFAMNSYGTPSMAAMVTVDNATAPAIVNPGSLKATRGAALNAPVGVSTPSGTLAVSAAGLPAGVTINAVNGTIGGTPTTNGHYLATIRASNGSQTTSTDVVIDVVDPVVNVTLTNSASFGYPALGTAFTDTVATGQTLTGANVRAGSWLDAIQGLATPTNFPNHGGTGGALSTASWGAADPLVRIYGKYSNNYVSQISFVSKSGKVFGPYGAAQAGGTTRTFDYTVPAGNKVYAFFGSADGYLRSIGVRYGSAAVYRTPSISAISAQQNIVGAAASVAATATDLDGNPLTYGATGLPNGISINTSTGVMSGTPTTVGTFNDRERRERRRLQCKHDVYVDHPGRRAPGNVTLGADRDSRRCRLLRADAECERSVDLHVVVRRRHPGERLGQRADLAHVLDRRRLHREPDHRHG